MNQTESHNLWSGPAGIKDVLTSALPLILSTACYSVMQFFDRYFLLQHSNEAAGAIAPAGHLLWTFVSFPLGIVTFLTAMVAQYDGSGQPNRIGKAVNHAFYFAAISCPLLALTAFFVQPISASMGHTPELANLESQAYNVYLIAGFAMLMCGVLEGFLVGLGDNQTVLNANIFATILNISLDPILILGFGPIPSLGILGATSATAISLWLKVFFVLYFVMNHRRKKEFQFASGWRLDFKFLKRFLFFGGPSGFQWFVEGAAITYFVLLFGKFGEGPMAAVSLTISYNSIVFIPIYGLGLALTAMTGRYLGEKKPELVKRSLWSSLVIGCGHSIFFATTFTVIPDFYIWLQQNTKPEFLEIIPMVRSFLFVVGLYCFFDSVQILTVSVLKGSGDTWFVSGSIVIATVLFYFGCQYVMKSEWSGSHQIWALWIALMIWLIALSVAFSIRVLQGKWQKIQIVEDPEDSGSAQLAVEST